MPHDIRGYEAKVDGERVLYRSWCAPPGSPAAFRDVGKRIDVLDWQSVESTLAAVELSAVKWGEFVVAGSEKFKARCARHAAEHGFQITNPELKETIERERTRLDAATKFSVDPEPSPEPREPHRERDIEPETAVAPVPPTFQVAEELHDVFAAREDEDASRAFEHYGADAVRLAKEFRRLSEEHGELWVDFNAKDQATGTLRFIDRDGMARHTSRESGIALARMEALLTRRPPEDIPELKREITKAIAQELAQVHERRRCRKKQRGQIQGGAGPRPGTRGARGTARGAATRTQRAVEPRERRIRRLVGTQKFVAENFGATKPTRENRVCWEISTPPGRSGIPFNRMMRQKRPGTRCVPGVVPKNHLAPARFVGRYLPGCRGPNQADPGVWILVRGGCRQSSVCRQRFKFDRG